MHTKTPKINTTTLKQAIYEKNTHPEDPLEKWHFVDIYTQRDILTCHFVSTSPPPLTKKNGHRGKPDGRSDGYS